MHTLQKKPPWGAEPTFELGPVLLAQQADALTTQLLFSSHHMKRGVQVVCSLSTIFILFGGDPCEQYRHFPLWTAE